MTPFDVIAIMICFLITNLHITLTSINLLNRMDELEKDKKPPEKKEL